MEAFFFIVLRIVLYTLSCNMKLLNICLLLLLPVLVSAQKAKKSTRNLIVGTYTEPGKSEGLYVYEFNSRTGDLTFKSKAPGIDNPSYLVISNNQKNVYAVNETGREKPGGVSAFAFDAKAGNLKFLNKVGSMGDDPCYISIDKRDKNVFAGTYSGGNLSAFKIQSDGSLSTAAQVIQHEGSSANKSRQEKPHVHCTAVSPDHKFLFAVDLGTDKINSYRIQPGNFPNILTEHQPAFTKVAPGSGPRHITFHPNGKIAYVVFELTGEVAVFDYRKGTLSHLQTATMLPSDYNGAIGAADIHISADGKFLYASNRGDANEIVIYSVAENGLLTYAGRQSTLGKAPRNFVIDPSGKFLLVANQRSDEIVVFSRNADTGLLKDTGKRINVGQPVCLKFAKL